MEFVVLLLILGGIYTYWRKILEFFLGLAILAFIAWGIYWVYDKYTTPFWWSVGGFLTLSLLYGIFLEYTQRQEIKRNILDFIDDNDLYGLAEYYLEIPSNNQPVFKEIISSSLSSKQRKLLPFFVLVSRYQASEDSIIFDEKEADVFLSEVVRNLLSRKIGSSFSFMGKVIDKYFSDEFEINRQKIFDEKNDKTVNLVIIKTRIAAEESEFHFENAISLD